MLTAKQRVLTLEIKHERAQLNELLSGADLVITSMRPSVLERLGLSRPHESFAQLSLIEIVGHDGDHAEVPGHDLNYQAVHGTLNPPDMPKVPIADLPGAGRAVSTAVAALVTRARTGVGQPYRVVLEEAAARAGDAVRFGLMGDGAPLGGAFPGYGIYECADGHVALGAIEPHFYQRTLDVFGVDGSHEGIRKALAEKTVEESEAGAAQSDSPLNGVKKCPNFFPLTVRPGKPTHIVTFASTRRSSSAQHRHPTRSVGPHSTQWIASSGTSWVTPGLLGLDLPEEYGGTGGDFGLSAVVGEEMALAHDSASGWPVHSPIVAHYVNTYGDDEQKQRWMPGIISGDKVLAIAMTEPGTGSDLQAIKTTAIRDGDHYVINGSNTFISNGTHCDLLVLVAKTDPTGGAAGVSLIVVETDDELEGFERGRVLEKVGQHGQDTRELFFSDVRAPVANLLGENEGLGFYQLMEQLAREWLIIASVCAGMAEAALLEAIKYTKQRAAFGKPLIKFQHNKFQLAELKAEVLSIKTTVDYCVQDYIDGRNDPAMASMAKLIAADKACDVVDRCVQFFGGYGYMMEYPIARAYAAARVNKIYGGTSEIMKEIISRTL